MLTTLTRGTAHAQPVLPPEFTAIQMTPPLINPVAMAFAPDGRLFVAERAGVVKVIQNNAIVSTFIDLTDEVTSPQFSDRGLLGLALDPAFLTNRRVYLFFSVDPVFGEPDEGNETPTFSRLVRYEGTLESNGNVADPASRTILIGTQPAGGVPQCWRSHGVGALRFAPDGSLLAAHGESAVFNGIDPGGLTPECFEPPLFNPAQDIGAFRAQMINSMSGKILRIDPETGNGLPTNPYWLGDPNAPRARVWVSGLRNPYRFTLKPGTGSGKHPGTIFLGDVGWNTFEEINVAVMGGENFGWPCREGFAPTPDYPEIDLQQWDCASIGSQANPGPLTMPLIAYHHFNPALSLPPNIIGRVATAGVFHVGDNYPSPYRGGFFFADTLDGWINVARVDAANELLGVHDFADSANGPVDFAIDPLTGEICYVALFEGVVYRLHSLIGPGDVDRNGVVDVDDLIAIILSWGPCADPITCPEDLNVSGEVDVDDLIEVIINWG